MRKPMHAITGEVTQDGGITEEQRKRQEEIAAWSTAHWAQMDEDDKLILKYEILKNGRIDLLCLEVLGYQVTEFHMLILKFCMAVMHERGEGLLMAPRGFGKSTIGTTAFAIFLILINPNIRILITSSTASKSEGFLQEIKAHFEYNVVLREVFGEYVNPRGWNTTSIFVWPRTIIAKEGTVTAYGQSGQVVSKHYDVIINDDPVNEDTARTKLRRDKLKDWIYTSMLPTLMPEGFMITTGTRYHPEDLFGYMESTAIATRKDLAKSGDPDSKVLKPLRVLKLKAVIDEGRSSERSLWPERFPLIVLKDQKRKMGSIRFGGQMQQETDLMRGKIIKERDIMWYNRSKVNTATLQIFMGVDLAIGQEIGNDKFALITKGYDPNTNKAYTLDIVHGQFSFREQIVIILWKAGKNMAEIEEITGYKALRLSYYEDLIQKFMPEACWNHALKQWPGVIRIGIEAVSYQQVLPNELLNLWTTLPVVKIKALKDKPTRYIKYSPRFENHYEFFPEDGSADILKDETIAAPDGDFDDLIDAHEFANQAKDMVFSYDAEDEGEISVKNF